MSEWHVAPGDPTHVFVGTAKPINCFSKDRAAVIAAAPELLDAVRSLLAWQEESKHAVPRIYLERAHRALSKAESY